MPTELVRPSSPPTTWPQYPVDEAGKKLAEFFVERQQDEWTDASQLFSLQVTYQKVESYLNDGELTVQGNAGLAFYEAIRKLYTAVKKPEEWVQVIGAVAEVAIKALVAVKYGTKATSHFTDEMCARIHDCPLPPPKKAVPLATTKDKPIDVICWNIEHDHGEMHEVKRLIISFKDAEKLRLMRHFKAIAQKKAGCTVWIGLAGFYDPLEDAQELLRTLLQLWEEQEPLGLDILVPDTYEHWKGLNFL